MHVSNLAESRGDKAKWVLTWPLIFLLCTTIPNCSKPRWEKFFMATFITATLWIAVFSYLMVWLVSGGQGHSSPGHSSHRHSSPGQSSHGHSSHGHSGPGSSSSRGTAALGPAAPGTAALGPAALGPAVSLGKLLSPNPTTYFSLDWGFHPGAQCCSVQQGSPWTVTLTFKAGWRVGVLGGGSVCRVQDLPV